MPSFFGLPLWQEVVAGVLVLVIPWFFFKTRRWLQGRDLVRKELVRLREHMKDLRNRIRTPGPLWGAEREVERLCRSIEADVIAVLKENNLEDEIRRFESDTTAKQERFQPGAPFHISNWGNFIERRLDALDDIIAKL